MMPAPEGVCDSCRFKKINYSPPDHCPNFSFFFDSFMNAYAGQYDTEKKCPKWEAFDELQRYFLGEGTDGR